MHSVTPDPEAEPLETVIPRLLECMAGLIGGLKAQGVEVETSNSFLLDLTPYPYQVPKTLNEIPVQMSFAGSIPGWADRVRYHLHVHIVGDRRWSMCEPPKGFNLPRIVDRIVAQLDNLKREQTRRDQVARDRSLAEGRLASLGAATQLIQESPLRLHQDNLRIDGLPDAPDEVQVTVRTSHANAEKIAREFRRTGRGSRKLEDR